MGTLNSRDLSGGVGSNFGVMQPERNELPAVTPPAGPGQCPGGGSKDEAP